jgi:hypothetical protein
MWVWLGLRPDLGAAVATPAYWMKFAYTIALCLVAFRAVERLSRPGGTAWRSGLAVAVAAAAMALLAGMEIVSAAPAERMRLLLGASSDVCPWRIVALSGPVFAGTLWAMRGLAPTRPALAGAAAGLAAGAAGAWIYAFYCTESAAAFVAAWYSLGIAGVTLVGALAGRFVLRW